MEFSFLKFWVPSFFVLNKTERGATLSLILSEFTDSIVVVVVLLFYVHGKHLRSCRDGQLT